MITNEYSSRYHSLYIRLSNHTIIYVELLRIRIIKIENYLTFIIEDLLDFNIKHTYTNKYMYDLTLIL